MKAGGQRALAVEKTTLTTLSVTPNRVKLYASWRYEEICRRRSRQSCAILGLGY